jgi:hypothetical protein
MVAVAGAAVAGAAVAGAAVAGAAVAGAAGVAAGAQETNSAKSVITANTLTNFFGVFISSSMTFSFDWIII